MSQALDYGMEANVGPGTKSLLDTGVYFGTVILLSYPFKFDAALSLGTRCKCLSFSTTGVLIFPSSPHSSLVLMLPLH